MMKHTYYSFIKNDQFYVGFFLFDKNKESYIINSETKIFFVTNVFKNLKNAINWSINKRKNIIRVYLLNYIEVSVNYGRDYISYRISYRR